MSEWRLFPERTVPEWTTREFYAERETAPHLHQEGHRDRLQVSAAMVRDALALGRSREVVDLGAGDGGLLSILPVHVRGWGYDLQPSNIMAATANGLSVFLVDVVTDWPRTGADEADIVVATEFLEHLIDPHEMVRRIAATKARYLIASSPYTETPDSHYEFHTWAFDLVGYRALLEDNGWKVLQQEKSWISQICLAEKGVA